MKYLQFLILLGIFQILIGCSKISSREESADQSNLNDLFHQGFNKVSLFDHDESLDKSIKKDSFPTKTIIPDNKKLNIRTIHVFVALCDNVNQGIVPVPARIGNGQDPKNNLYWGAGYGVKNFFYRKSSDWTLIKCVQNPKDKILERCIFKHSSTNTYLLADAYDGAEIKQTTIDLLKASAGDFEEVIEIDTLKVGFGGYSDLIAYTGHDGLMDFTLDEFPKQKNEQHRDVIILACYSRDFFTESLKITGAYPLVWTTHLMAPEAYTLKAAIDGWIKNESNEEIRMRAVNAYNNYQKCGLRGAKNLLVTGW